MVSLLQTPVHLKREVTEHLLVEIPVLGFSKAFDIVSQNTLVTKLRKCGIHQWTVRWIDGRLAEL